MADKPAQDDSARAYLAPADLRQHSLPSQAALGFHRGSTEELLGRAADTIERLQGELLLAEEAKEVDRLERSELNARLEEATKRAELLVGETMVEAHKAGQALKAEAEADAEKLRAEAEALLAPARQEAAHLVAEAEHKADRLVVESEAERDRLAAEVEQYKLLAADVQQRTIEFLKRGLEALGADSAASEVGEDVARFAAPNEKPPASDPPTQPSGDERLTASRPLPAETPEPLPVTDSGPETLPDPNEVPPDPTPVLDDDQVTSNFADDPMTRLWQSADGPAGAEAVEAIRARRKASSQTEENNGRHRWRRGT